LVLTVFSFIYAFVKQSYLSPCYVKTYFLVWLFSPVVVYGAATIILSVMMKKVLV
jgi:hypothetical protein